MNKRVVMFLAAAMAIAFSPARAQDNASESRAPVGSLGSTAMETMSHGAMPGMEHDMTGMEAKNQAGEEPALNHDSDGSMDMDMDMSGMNQGASGTEHDAVPGPSPAPDARDPHAFSDGYDFGPIPRPRMADELNFGSLLIDRLEGVRTGDSGWTTYDLQGWYGRTYDRAVLKAEGDIDGGALEEARTELLWGHAVAPFWDTQLGLRYDSGAGPDRRWLAFGIEGLAPYWFDVAATAYAGEAGRTALRLETSYDLLFTQRLILQPRIEANLYGKDDDERGLGAGLSDIAAGLRLRYEIRRELAPYVGVEWAGLYGGTAAAARAVDQDTRETRAAVGVRFWF